MLRIVDNPDMQPAIIKPVPVQQLIDDHPVMLPAVIEGLLRRGETMNVIAAAKTGKSFMVNGMALCVATGRPWLSHEVVQGNVLIIDNELHPETFASRLKAIADAMMIDNSELDSLDALTVRGIGLDINGLGARLGIEPGKYSLIVLDALYRFLPEGTSENDNAQMMRVYNKLDEYAKTWDCGIVVVHHASKGAQGDKAVTDVGAGAGSIARAVDTHLVIRSHEQDGLCVLEAGCRSFKSPEAVSIKYEYPLWDAIAVEPEVKKSPGGKTKADSEKMDRDADQQLTELLQGHWLSEAQIVRKTGMGPTRVSRAVGRAVATGEVTSKRVRRQGRKVMVYGSTATQTATAENGVAGP